MCIKTARFGKEPVINLKADTILQLTSGFDITGPLQHKSV